MERLKQLRNEKGLTQQEVSDAVGVARETYARYESGARTPDIDMLSRLADLFGVSTDYLLGRTDIPNAYIQEGDGIESYSIKIAPPMNDQGKGHAQCAQDEGQPGVTLSGGFPIPEELQRFVEQARTLRRHWICTRTFQRNAKTDPERAWSIISTHGLRRTSKAKIKNDVVKRWSVSKE